MTPKKEATRPTSPYTREVSRAVQERYAMVVERTKDLPMEFMNYGYAAIDGENGGPDLTEEQACYRFQISLYHHTLHRANLAGKIVLEVGSGRGGGADFIARTMQPQRLIGLDLNQRQVALCEQRYGRPRLAFIQGDAESMPFADAEFDVVLNVESSHCYPDQSAFFREVHRVLKPAGHFLYTDFRDTAAMDPLRGDLLQAGFRIVRETDITRNVVKSLELDNARKSELLAKAAGNEEERRQFRIAYAMIGEDIPASRYYKFRAGTCTYYSFILMKP